MKKMKSLLPSLEKEAAYLRRIPAFDPRFRQAYGSLGFALIGAVAIVLLCFGVWWLAPWESGYLPEERKSIWFGVAVTPFASFLAATFIVEFLLKTLDVARWIGAGTLTTPIEAKIAAWICAALAGSAMVIPLIRAEWDLWGYLALFLSLPVLYAFVTLAWDATCAKRTPNQSIQHNAGSRPSSNDPPASVSPSAPAPRGRPDYVRQNSLCATYSSSA